MNRHSHRLWLLVASLLFIVPATLQAADWPQWLGPSRDGKAPDFKPPTTWPKELKETWKVNVGLGAASPALVGDKVFVFAREGEDEVTLCLDAKDGKQIWKDKYAAISVNGPASSHPGPRSSPAVADGKVVTFGVGAVLSCLDAESGKVLWRKESAKDFSPAYPNFYTSMSPLLADGMCIAHLGGGGKGAVVAYDLKTGNAKWTWEGDAPAYASPVLMSVDGVKQVVDLGAHSLVGLSLTDGKLLWQTQLGDGMGQGMGRPRGGPGGPGGPGGGMRGRGMGGRSYNAVTPLIDGQMVIVASQGFRALKVQKSGEGFSAKDLWSNPEVTSSFATPVVADGRIYGLTGSNSFFCLDAATGKTLWTSNPAGGGGRGRGGFGSIVNAGNVLIALTPSSELVVFKPSDKEFSEVARIKVADSPTYAYPVIAGNQILIKSQDSVALFTLE